MNINYIGSMFKQKKYHLTVLCDPIPYGERRVKELLKRLYILIRDLLFLRIGKNKLLRGHASVTRSLVFGLKENGIIFNYNPISINNVAESVIVLSGVETLRQAIENKTSGRIKNIFAGPNIVERSSDYDGLLNSKQIDLVITPSEWVKNYYIEFTPEIATKTFVWPAGVDIKYWIPNKRLQTNKKILIYLKKIENELNLNQYLNFLKQEGYSISFIRYGEYTKDEYLFNLQRSSIMIAFSSIESESQCIAFAEAWSCDVPIFTEQKLFSNHRGYIVKSSSSPYHSSWNGLFYKDFNDFKCKIKMWSEGHYLFNPREYVLKNLTDAITVKSLLHRIGLNKIE